MELSNDSCSEQKNKLNIENTSLERTDTPANSNFINANEVLPINSTQYLNESNHEKKESPDTSCLPLVTVSDVLNFQLPEWAKKTEPLQQNSDWCIAGNIPCHVPLEKWYPLPRFVRSSIPRTLVCHDMRGGYLEDRYVEGSTADDCYTFQQWWGIDIFVYFSHNLITIPPLGWINAAHRHGVKILGTFITEWISGVEMLSSILKNDSSINSFIDSIISITSDLRIDGWLLNIENIVGDVQALIKFIYRLNNKLKELNPSNILIWYDSVTNDGKLKWQNELNDKNRCWFNLCDGIFLNYTWTEENLHNSLRNAGNRTLDVFVGVDVFGRHCKGGMDSAKSLDLIRKYGFSLALFAPGWTHETTPIDPKETFRERYEENDKKFWLSLRPFLYERGPSVYFKSNFGRGFSKDHFNINDQEIQLMNHVYTGEISPNKINWRNDNAQHCFCVEYSNCSMLSKRSSVCISNVATDQLQIQRLIMCDIVCNENVVVTVFTKLLNDVPFDNLNTVLDICLMIQEKSGRFKSVCLVGCNNPSNDIFTRLNSDLEINSVSPNSEEFQTISQLTKVSNMKSSWNQSSYILKMPGARILEIGACLRGKGSAAILLGGIYISSYTIQ